MVVLVDWTEWTFGCQSESEIFIKSWFTNSGNDQSPKNAVVHETKFSSEIFPILKEVQKCRIKFWHSNNSDWSFNMGIYEKISFYYFELFRKISNTQLENYML